MGNSLIPGHVTDITDPGNPAFVDSMATQIEHELSALMTSDGLPPLSFDLNEQGVRDRRRLFVAIARGVIVHLGKNPGAFVIHTNQPSVSASLQQISESL